MKYSTKLTQRQVMLAFDLYIQRLMILATRNSRLWFTLRDCGLRPQQTPTKLPVNLNLKAIADRCGLSNSTLSRLIADIFIRSKLKRANAAKFVRRFYRP